MSVNLMKFLTIAAVLSLLCLPAAAQVGQLGGKVIGENGEPVTNAVIKLERVGIKGEYQVKTHKKKGTWFHAGLPIGTYNVSLIIDGKVVDRLMGVRVGLGQGDPIDFDLAEIANRQAAAQATASSGPSKEALAAMSEQERKQYEEALKKRQEQLTKNKELNEAFNLGMTAKRAGDFETAVANLKKAHEIDPEQDVVLANLADAQVQLAEKKVGDERKQLFNDAVETYQKALALQPQNAAYHNNLGLALVKAGRIEEGQAELAKAAEMDPQNGGRYYFNLGAVMVNSGNTDGAVEAFRKATEVDPNYAAAYYQLGTALVGKAETKADGTVVPVPGTVEAFQKYLELEPNGPYAQSAQMMIQTLTGPVDTSYQNPDAKKRTKK